MAKRRTTQNPMCGDQAALHHAIIQNPDDDTVRLVYADLLQEKGDPERAEFIRLQIHLSRQDGVLDRDELQARGLRTAYADWLKQRRDGADDLRKHLRQPHLSPLEAYAIKHVYADRLQEEGDDGWARWHRPDFLFSRRDPVPGRGKLEERVARLLADHRGAWEGELHGRGVQKVEFERGFPVAVTATAEAFIRSGGQWLQRHPLRRVSLTDVSGRVRRLAATGHLSHVRHLELSDPWLQPADLIAAAEKPRSGGDAAFAGLESLAVCGIGVLPPDAVAALGALPRLRGLWLKSVMLNPDAVEAMAAGGFENLEVLGATYGAMDAVDLFVLLGSQRLPRLTDVGFTCCGITGEAVEVLAHVPARTALREVMLVETDVTRIDVDRLGVALGKHPGLRLDLRNCRVPSTTRGQIKRRFGDRVIFGPLRYPLHDLCRCSGWYRLQGSS